MGRWRCGASGHHVILEYTPTRQSMLAGVRLQTNWFTMTFAIGGGFGLVLLLIPVFEGQPLPPIDLLLVQCAFGGLFFGLGMSVLLWLAIYPYRTWIVHRQNPALFGQTELVTDDRGVEFKTARGATRYDWSDFRGYREGRTVFSLCLSKSASFTLPKKDLTPEAVREFRDELSRTLKRLR